MILQRYQDLRAAFALAGAPIALDGFETWPMAKLRAGAFTGLVTPTIAAYPIAITCNAGGADATPGVHEYDWYLSQRSDLVGGQYLSIVHPDPLKSGSVSLALELGNVARLLPGLTGPDLLADAALALIFKSVALYVSRRSDRAYQWIPLVAPL